MDERLIYQTLSVVEEIPEGRVAIYGQIARLVGRGLIRAEFYGSYPCHRVVNAHGRLAPGFFNQKSLLLGEGVPFCGERVDLKKALWSL